MTLLYGIIFSTFVVGIQCVCEDKNTKACERLAAIKPDMCRDTCTASLCPRTCGKCPLICYTCDDVDHPYNCTKTAHCSNMKMSCIATQTVTSALEKKYQLGCVDNQVCENLYNSIPSRHTLASREVDLLGGCCATDLCNKYDEPDKEPVPTIHHEQASARTQGFSPECQQIDDEVCKLFHQSDSSCSTCISSICPQECNKCSLVCYNCTEANLPGNCSDRLHCHHETQVCITTESHTGGYNRVYKLGCTDRQGCETLKSKGVDVTCCDSNFCNANHIPKTTISPTTATTTHHHTPHVNLGIPKDCHNVTSSHTGCPNGFEKRHNSCYYIGRQIKIQSEAKKECESLCSRLAIISSSRENIDVTHLLQHMSHHAEEKHYWLDGYRVGGIFTGTWKWTSTGTIIGNSHSFSYFRSDSTDSPSHAHPNRDGEHCLNIGRGESEEDKHHHHLNDKGGYFWDHRSCGHRYAALCEYPLSNEP